MKKILLASLVATSGLFAISDSDIVEFYAKSIPDVKVEIQKREKIKEYPEFEVVSVKITGKDGSHILPIFTKGDLVFPDIIDLKKSRSYNSEYQQKMSVASLKGVYKSEDPTNIISIGHDKGKPTQVVFSDPECPYCRAELKEIEKTLTKYNVKIILTPVHQESALQKSFLAYKDIANAKTDSEKVRILRKYFAQDYKVPAGAVSDSEVQKMDELRNKYFSAGLRSVPTIFVDEDSVK